MPIVEYRCDACAAKFSLLLGMTAEPDDERCPKCGATQLTRLVSRFARVRTEDQRLDELADRADHMGEPDSPAAMREMVREMGKAMDDDMSDDMEEMLESDFDGGGEGDVL